MRIILRRRHATDQGVTFVSVIVALVLLGLVAAVFASAFDLALHSSKVVGHTSQALSIAQHKIDQMRAVGYGRLIRPELVAAGIIDPYPETLPYSFQYVDSLNEWFPEATGQILIAQEAQDLRCVTVTIRWTGTSKTSGDVTLMALISRE